MSAKPPDVLVMGAGPAGAAAARLLSLWGHAVALVTRPEADTGDGLAESLTPSCGKLFDLLGVRDRVDAAGFVRATGNTVWWGAGAPRVEMFAGGALGWQATAPVLERVLTAAAADAGAAIHRRLLTAAEAASLPARFRLDCTGRAGLLARARAGRRYEPAHRTVALSGVWRRADGWNLPDWTHTVVESYADGWAWSVPLDPARRAVAVMVDPRTTTLARGEGAQATYRAELDKTVRLAGLLADAQLEDGPAGWDASMYDSRTYGGADWLVAGDAASFVDPLSSAGVKKALASGWLAAVVVNTALRTPEMAATAVDFFAQREAEVYAGFRALTERYLHDAAEGQAHPFWAERAEAGDRHLADEDQRRERDAVQAAYDRLRSRDAFAVAPGPGVRIEPRPAIAGREIVLEPRVVGAGDHTGVRFLYDVDVVTLVRLAPSYRQVPDLYDACVRSAGPVDLGAFLTALATAMARRWLVEV